MDGPSPELRSDAILFLAASAYELAVVIIPKYLKEKNVLSARAARKIMHGLAGLAVVIAPYLHHPLFAAVIAAAGAVATRISGATVKFKALRTLYEAIGEERERDVGYLQGPFAYSLGIAVLILVFVLFPDKYYFPIAAILIMMYSDSLAAAVGRRWGKRRIPVPWTGGRRTVEGSLAFFGSGFGLSVLTFLTLGRWFPGHSAILAGPQILGLSLAISGSAAILEIVSPSKYDDLIVPLGATLTAGLAAAVFGAW